MPLLVVANDVRSVRLIHPLRRGTYTAILALFVASRFPNFGGANLGQLLDIVRVEIADNRPAALRQMPHQLIRHIHLGFPFG
jgi:hypothetical protein